MTTLDVDSQPVAFLAAEQLYVGAYVMLDLPWFKHSFTLNSFKVKNAEQLRELQSLRLARYRYDPNRSDPAPCPIDPLALSAASEPALAPPTPDDGAALTSAAARKQKILARRESVEQVEQAFAKAATVVKNLNKHVFSRPRETLEELKTLAIDMVDVFMVCPEATLHVMGEKAGGEDVYFHSLNVAILAMMLAKGMAMPPDEARDMCMGALLHDIGLMEIPDRVAKKPSAEANKAERILRATHVNHSVTIGKKLGLPPIALQVVAQHHEFADGSGYPKGLRLEDMPLGARVVSLINYYDNLCNPSDASKTLTPHEALSHMFAHCRAKFDPRALQLLIRSLGVHPPGSVVQLSNESFAMVTSVNPQKPLRPWVLVYDESVPKDEAIMLNLEDEAELQIVKSIRPNLLSPKVAAYLNPRKRVTYFFDGQPTSHGQYP